MHKVRERFKIDVWSHKSVNKCQVTRGHELENDCRYRSESKWISRSLFTTEHPPQIANLLKLRSYHEQLANTQIIHTYIIVMQTSYLKSCSNQIFDSTNHLDRFLYKIRIIDCVGCTSTTLSRKHLTTK